MGRNLALPPPLDYAPVEDLGEDYEGMEGMGDWADFALDLVPSMQEIKEGLTVAGSGAAALLAGSMLLPKVLPASWSPKLKNGVALLLAIAGAKVAVRYNRALALGILGGLGGLAVANIVSDFLGKPVSLGDFSESPEERLLSEFLGEEDESLMNLSQLPEEEMLSAYSDEGMGRVEVESGMNGFGVVGVERVNPLGAIIGSF
jgi:hypothetical protein